jgi:hypothetical protein
MNDELSRILFSSLSQEPITMLRYDGGLGLPTKGLAKAAASSELVLPGDRGCVLAIGEDITKGLAAADGDQFMVFQLNNSLEGPTILDATEVQPSIDGNAENPDVLVAIQMLAFHVAENEGIDKNTRATLRMDIGKDESSTDKRFDTVFWSIAAGLQLYNNVKSGKTESKDLKSDFSQALSKRPIEIPGALGRVTFNVLKHQEQPWWKQIFTFLESDTAKGLVSAFGLPAVTLQVINVFDQLLNRISDSSPKILFAGRPMRLAFSKQARTEFTGGNPRVSMGCLNGGFCVFARGRDFNTVAKSNAVFYPTIGKLVPATVHPGEIAAGGYDDPLQNVTYAVFKVGTKATKLDPTFNYGG